MKRRNEFSSSLEMLLDTMCNTFGAVVFLCITLAVVLSMRVEMPPEPAADEAELRRLQKEFVTASAKITELARVRHLTVEDRQILQLTQLLEEHRIAIREARLEEAKLNLQEKQLEKSLAAAQRSNRKLEEELRKRSQERQELEKACRELLKNAESRQPLPEMSFSRRQKSEEAPYYFIITPDGRLHRLGMELRGGAMLPADEVDYQQQGNCFICRAKAGSGRPLMRAETEVDPGVWQILDELKKQGRPPYFLLAKECAASFYHLRFALRQRQITFGWSPLSQEGFVSIMLVDQGHWEYGQ